jgi:hypothetical protein
MLKSKDKDKQPITHPVIGFRSWIPTREKDGALQSRFGHLYVWTKGANQAKCYRYEHAIGNKQIRSPQNNRVVDGVPSSECSCGLYCHHDYQKSLDYIPGSDIVIFGIVKGWGRVEVHYDGFRCQYAEILAIVPGPNMEYAKKAADFYDVPLITGGDIELIASEFGKKCPTTSRPTWEDTQRRLKQSPSAPPPPGVIVFTKQEQQMLWVAGLTTVVSCVALTRLLYKLAKKGVHAIYH